MKNLLALSTALIALVSVDVSASKLTGSEWLEVDTYGARGTSIDELIGVKTLQGQNNAVQNSVDDLVDLRTRLVGDGSAANVTAFQAVTHRANAVTGMLPTFSDTLDILDAMVGTSANINTLLTYTNSANTVFDTIDDAGGNAANLWEATSNGDLTPATPAFVQPDTAIASGTAFRLLANMRLIYNRLFRDESNTADQLNVAGRRARMVGIAAGYGFDGATLPTQDQFTLPMLAHFLAAVSINNTANRA